MFNLIVPPCNFTKFEDSTPGFEGAEGWWSDDLIPGKRVLYFMGTWWDNTHSAPFKGKGDFLADILIFPLRTPWNLKYRIHGGFQVWALNGWDATVEIRKTDKPLVIIGHSLGANIAAQVALRHKQTFPNSSVEVQLFSMPTCFANYFFKKDFQKTLPLTRNHTVGFDVPKLLWLFSLPLFLLGNPVKNVHYTYKHIWKNSWKHPIKRIGEFVNFIGQDHQPATIIEYVDNPLF